MSVRERRSRWTQGCPHSGLPGLAAGGRAGGRDERTQEAPEAGNVSGANTPSKERTICSRCKEMSAYACECEKEGLLRMYMEYNCTVRLRTERAFQK